MGITRNDLNMPKDKLRDKIKAQAIKATLINIQKAAQKYKMTNKYYKNCRDYEVLGFGKNYTDNMTAYGVKIIMEARLSLFPSKKNYKHVNYEKVICRWCENAEETESHILEECENSPIINEGWKTQLFFGAHNITLSEPILRKYHNIIHNRGEKF